MFQFTHPGRGATEWYGVVMDTFNVSIHAPREGCDESPYRYYCKRTCFNSRTPGGVRPLLGGVFSYFGQFQFTHPGRGATPSAGSSIVLINRFQFTHPGRGATYGYAYRYFRERVSIHAPREGCDSSISGLLAKIAVSIHAPREGCDSVVQSCVLWGG